MSKKWSQPKGKPKTKRFIVGNRYHFNKPLQADYLRWEDLYEKDTRMPKGEYEYIGNGKFAVAEGKFVSKKHIYKPKKTKSGRLKYLPF